MKLLIILLTIVVMGSLYADDPSGELPTDVSGERKDKLQGYQLLFEDKVGGEIQYLTASMAGFAATGVVIREDEGSITINTTPCKDEAIRMMFVSPFIVSSVSDVECNGAVYSRIQVIQLGDEWVHLE